MRRLPASHARMNGRDPQLVMSTQREDKFPDTTAVINYMWPRLSNRLSVPPASEVPSQLSTRTFSLVDDSANRISKLNTFQSVHHDPSFSTSGPQIDNAAHSFPVQTALSSNNSTTQLQHHSSLSSSPLEEELQKRIRIAILQYKLELIERAIRRQRANHHRHTVQIDDTSNSTMDELESSDLEVISGGEDDAEEDKEIEEESEDSSLSTAVSSKGHRHHHRFLSRRVRLPHKASRKMPPIIKHRHSTKTAYLPVSHATGRKNRKMRSTYHHLQKKRPRKLLEIENEEEEEAEEEDSEEEEEEEEE